MSNKENFDLDALVAAADSLPPELRGQFLDLMPPTVRNLVLERIGEAVPSMATKQDDAGSVTNRILPPTVIVDPGAELECENATSDNSFKSAGSSSVSLVKLHARGAVGEVFVAFDDRLTREIALKKVRNDLPNNKQRFKRFIREAKITANLQHPGIVPIYDLSVSGNEAHYTMPLVSGSTLSELIQQTHSELNDRVSIDQWTSKMRPLLTRFIAVCNAVDYAHSQDVLHRDLKPANIMIGTQGQTLVLDWGCAKSLSEESEDEESTSGIEDDELAKIYGIEPRKQMTVMGSVMGTIAFMSPEQASGDSRKIGIPSDIFGLGATLFNLLTNEVAYECEETSGSSVEQALEAINCGKHRSIDEVSTRVPAPLAAICKRSMAFDPKDRYATAAELAKDIDLFLAGEPVSAWKEPLSKRATRFIKRYRTLFATLAGTLLVGFVSLAFSLWASNQQKAELAGKNTELKNVNVRLEDVNVRLSSSLMTEKRLKSTAVKREAESRQQLYESEMLLASEASSEPGGFGRMRQLVQRWSGEEQKLTPGWELRHLNKLGNREYWKADLDATANRIFFTRDNPAGRVFDSDQLLLFKIDVDSKEVLDQRNLPRNATAVDFNRDQSLMAIGMRDGSVRVTSVDDSSSEPVVFKKLDSAIIDIRWNIGGDYIAACDASGKIALWQWYEREIKYTGKGVLTQTGKQLLNWSYDGKKLYWTTREEIIELIAESRIKKVLTQDSWILNPCWSHEGKLVAYIGPDNTIVVKDLNIDRTTRFTGHQLFIESLQWHPSRHYLLSSSFDGSVRIWNTDTEQEVRQLLGHDGQVYSAAWSSDGSKVVSGGLPEDQLHVWDVSDLGSEFDSELLNHPAFDWHPGGTEIALASGADIVIQNDALESRTIAAVDTNESEIFGIAYNPAGDQIACIAQTGRIWTVDAKSGGLLQLYDSGSGENRYPEVTSKAIAWSPDGNYLAGVGGKGKIRVWDLSTGDNIGEKFSRQVKKTLAVSWSPLDEDGVSRLALAGIDDFIYVFDPGTRKVVNRMIQDGWKTGLAWSPDGKKIGVSDQRSIAIWNVQSEKLIGNCDGPSAMIRDISWSNSQDRIAALAEDGTVCLWNDETLAYSAKFKLHQRVPYTIRWSPDGSRLASTARHGRLVFQTAETPKEKPPSENGGVENQK